ncbi:acyltransferase family protein [Pararobbsia silviterrae]|nr:acyltransferase [Pararobbsia silviterrae]
MDASQVGADRNGHRVQGEAMGAHRARERQDAHAALSLHSIQYLRAVAALMVVMLHLGLQWQRLGYAGPWPGWLAGGVDIFFVISGLIMWITTADRPMTATDFYARRLIRIAPLYWLLTAATVAIMLVAPHAIQSSHFDVWHVVASFLFLPSINTVTGQIEPVLIPGWTLNYEMLFYVVFGLSLRWRAPWRLASCALLLGAPIVWHAWTGQGHGVWLFYTSDAMLEFVLGMMLGWMYLRGGLRWGRLAGWGLIVCGVIALAYFGGLGYARLPSMGVPAFAIVAGALTLERARAVPRWRALHALGDASYSLYLSHPIVLSASEQLWRHGVVQNGTLARLAFSVFALTLTIAAAWICYRGLEQPLTRFLNRRLRPLIVSRSVASS